MPDRILFPALSPTMEKGSLIKWHVKAGDKVSPGDLLAEIETDKATMEFEAVDEAIIEKLLVTEGPEEVSVNTPIAEISFVEDVEPSHQRRDSNDEPENREKNAKLISEKLNFTSDQKDGEVLSDSAKQLEEKVNRLRISPLAKKLAKNGGISVSDIVGTGPYGRIIKKDVLKKIEKLSPSDETVGIESAKSLTSSELEQSQTAASEPDSAYREYEVIPLTRMRKVIAKRLSESKSTVPHFYLRRTIIMDKILDNRAQINEFASKRELKISINDFIIKACAKSLKDNPKCNCIWSNDKMLKLNSFDVGVAVALDDGLITPIIRNADKKTLGEISAEMKALAERARKKKLQPDEYSGGSFAISNLGMMGVENFDAVINPPNSSILAVGSTVVRPLARDDGTLYAGSTMSITLSADHRVIDGAVGASFIGSIVNYLENPMSLLL
ncbi:MAG: pyruvate dehydrogenase complex dihydrolipoamide acetyltransferase [Pseudomonadota bacterium]|nr:pyruvate dehydrogenase complex dihydrolipoamide acetyltransferase [Pseudomonadota bacterium]